MLAPSYLPCSPTLHPLLVPPQQGLASRVVDGRQAAAAGSLLGQEVNLDQLDDWLIARLGSVAAKAVEDWVWFAGALVLARLFGFGT